MFPANVDEVVTSPQATQAWGIALETAHTRARLAYPQESRRIDAAQALLETHGIHVRQGRVVVESQSIPGKTYDVGDVCGCTWFTYGLQAGTTRRCTHRWAYLLYAHAVEHLVRLYAAVYEPHGEQFFGIAQPLPEDSGHLFFHEDGGSHRFLPAPCSALTLLGKIAWIEDGSLCGSLPQALLDMSSR